VHFYNFHGIEKVAKFLKVELKGKMEIASMFEQGDDQMLQKCHIPALAFKIMQKHFPPDEYVTMW